MESEAKLQKAITEIEYADILARCRALPPAKGNYLVDDYVENLMLTVLDFQMHGTTVDRATQYYRKHRCASIRTHQDMTSLLGQYPDTKEGNLQIAQYLWGYNFWSRVELLRRLIAYLEANGVSSQEELQAWAVRTNFHQFNGKVKGAGYAIFKWLVMRLGVETIKPDVWIHRFLYSILGRSVTDIEAVNILEKAAHELGIRAYELDWRIWEHQRNSSSNQTE